MSYNIKLEIGQLATRHRRYPSKDIPEKAVEEVENSIHEVVDIPAHGGASGFTVSRVQTRSMKRRFLAKSALGKFHMCIFGFVNIGKHRIRNTSAQLHGIFCWASSWFFSRRL